MFVWKFVELCRGGVVLGGGQAVLMQLSAHCGGKSYLLCYFHNNFLSAQKRISCLWARYPDIPRGGPSWEIAVGAAARTPCLVCCYQQPTPALHLLPHMQILLLQLSIQTLTCAVLPPCSLLAAPSPLPIPPLNLKTHFWQFKVSD